MAGVVLQAADANTIIKVSHLMNHRKHSPERAYRLQAGAPLQLPCLDDWYSPSSSYQAFGLKGGKLQYNNTLFHTL